MSASLNVWIWIGEIGIGAIVVLALVALTWTWWRSQRRAGDPRAAIAELGLDLDASEEGALLSARGRYDSFEVLLQEQRQGPDGARPYWRLCLSSERLGATDFLVQARHFAGSKEATAVDPRRQVGIDDARFEQQFRVYAADKDVGGAPWQDVRNRDALLALAARREIVVREVSTDPNTGELRLLFSGYLPGHTAELEAALAFAIRLAVARSEASTLVG